MPQSVIVTRYVHRSCLRPSGETPCTRKTITATSTFKMQLFQCAQLDLLRQANSVTTTSQLLLDQARTRLDACQMAKLRVAFVSQYHNTPIYAQRHLSGIRREIVRCRHGMVCVSKIAITAPRRFRQGSSVTATNQERD